jgi:hypothetical protein
MVGGEETALDMGRREGERTNATLPSIVNVKNG